MGSSSLQALLALSVAERIELAEALWDSVAREAEAQPLHQHELAEVRQGLTEHQATPSDVVPWSEVKKSLGLRD